MKWIAPKNVGLLLAGLLGVFPVWADTVVLTNGRTLECTILSEHADHVEISMGAGSMNLSRSQIARLTRSKPGKTGESPREEYGNILSPGNAPPEYADLAAGFRALMEKRNAAMDAQYMRRLHEQQIRELEAKASHLEEEIDNLGNQQTELSKQYDAIKLPEIPSGRNFAKVEDYNRLVEEKQQKLDAINQLQLRITPLASELKETYGKIPPLQTRCRSAGDSLVPYNRELRNFANRYAERRAALPKTPGEAAKALFEKIDRLLARFQQELPSVKVDTRHKGNSTIVRVLLNDSVGGDFVLDTGADLMTITEGMARNLGMNLDALPSSTMTVADGSECKVKLAELMSVSVGEARVEHVTIFVVPDSPNNSEDGLLGMSFLKNFSMGFSSSAGDLELTWVKPSEH